MELRDYPRPQNDNGRGIHWFPTLGQKRAVVDQNVPRLVDLKMRWLVFWNGLDDAALLVNDYLIKKLVVAGITPVMHVYLRPIVPLDDAALARLHRLVAYYRDPPRRVDYFQLLYEPNVAGEWAEGQLPDDPVGRFLDTWLPAAQEVINAGGLPGFSPLWPGGDYDDLKFLTESLDGMKKRGREAVFDKLWIALHNYNLGHPISFNANSNGFKKFVWVNQIVAAQLSHSLPILTTEGGSRVGAPPYGDGVDEQQATVDTVEAYTFMKTAPDYYFCHCPWLFGNLLGGGNDPKWEPSAWFRSDASQQIVVKSVRALEDFARKLPPSPPPPPPAPKEKYFAETKHWVRGAFLDFFNHYGLELCGYPLGDAVTENNLPTQYFQRVVLEEYQPGKARPRPLGDEVTSLRAQVAQLQSALSSQPPEAGGQQELPARVNQLEEALSTAQSQVGQLQQEKTQLAGQVEELQAAIGEQPLAILRATQKLQDRVKQLEVALADAQAQNQKLARQLAELAAKQPPVNTGTQELYDRVNQLEEELATALSQAQSLQVERAQLLGRIEELKASQPPAVGGSSQEWQDRATTLEAALAEAQAQIQQLEEEKAQLAGQVEELKASQPPAIRGGRKPQTARVAGGQKCMTLS